MCQDYAENTLDYAGILTVNKVDVKAFLMYQTVSSEKEYFKKLFELSGSPKRSWSPLEILNKNLEMCCVKGKTFELTAESKEAKVQKKWWHNYHIYIVYSFNLI